MTVLPESLRVIQQRCPVRVATAEALVHGEDGPRLRTGWDEVDAALGSGLPTGLHEWFGAPLEANAGRCAAGVPPFCILLHLARQLLEQSPQAGWTVWVCDGQRPYAPAARGGDANDGRLLRRSLFVSARDGPTRQWIADTALRCRAVRAVMADGSGFDRAATRRLHLLARAQEKWIWLTRPPGERDTLSAALTRWQVRWHAGPGVGGTVVNPRWKLTLLRCKGVPLETIPDWILEWDHAEGAVRLSTALAGAVGLPSGAPGFAIRRGYARAQRNSA